MLGYTIVNVIFKNSPVQLGFTFKGYKAAEDLLKKCGPYFQLVTEQPSEHILCVEDDFGCKATIDMSTVCGVVLNDVDKEIIRGTDTRIEQDIVMGRRVREEQAKPANQIMMPQGKPIVANA